MDGSWFSQALARVGASQADLARHLRLAPSAVSRMLKGDRQMKPLEVVHIAAFLRVPEDEVLRHAVDTTSNQPVGDAPRPGRGRPPSVGTATPAASPSRPLQELDRITTRSGARGGTDQGMFLQDAPSGDTPTAAHLHGGRRACA